MMLRAAALLLTWVVQLSHAQEDAEIIATTREFMRLWRLVVVEGATRGAKEPNFSNLHLPPVRRVCQYGLGELGASVAMTLLQVPDLSVEEFEVHHAAAESERGAEELRNIALLAAKFGDRVVDAQALSPTYVAENPCDFAIFSKETSVFTIEALLQRNSKIGHAGIAFISSGCIDEYGETTTHHCGFLNMLWANTIFMRKGFCLERVCMSRVANTADLVDPNTFPLHCEELLGMHGNDMARNWVSPSSEFSQEWFALWNYLGISDRSDMVYVDVGANLPFEYSNTVVLERCLNWKGLCVEPNKGLAPWLDGYRNCQLLINCVHSDAAASKKFAGRDGGEAFSADCLSLDEVLTRGGLKGRRIDLLSVDVEASEMPVLRSLNWTDPEVDVSVVIVEVGRGVVWLEVEALMLRQGYIKVAVLGRDVVYVKYRVFAEDELWSTTPEWSVHEGAFIPELTVEDALPRSLAEAQAECLQNGDACLGVTCDSSLSLAACTSRAGPGLYKSQYGEVSYVRPRSSPGFSQLFSHGALVPLMPPSWKQFQQRVLDEEHELEAQVEAEMSKKGLRPR